MNTLVIAIRIEMNLQWPTLATLKAIARHELGRLKRKVPHAIERMAVNRIIERVAMAFTPMPSTALA